ncbi:serine/threonine protein kinase, partial [Corallococcus terminator]
MSTPNPKGFDPTYILPGEQVGYYQIERLIGRGGMGATYIVVRDGLRYALKIGLTNLAGLNPKQRREEEARFRREVAALSGLDHPHIVTVRGHDFTSSAASAASYPYLIMEYVEGSPLLTWRKDRKPSLRLLLTVFAQLGGALQTMHRLQIFHRDLKSDNVLVRTENDEPVVIDFGIARPLSTQTVTRAFSVVGTMHSWSPEYCQYMSSQAMEDGQPFVNTPQAD